MKHSWEIIDSGHCSGSAVARRVLPPEELNLPSTLECGQAFRWRRAEAGEWAPGPVSETYQGIVRGRVLLLGRSDDWIFCRMFPGPFDTGMIDDYLDLGVSLPAVRAAIDVDEHINAALLMFPGLRMLQQEPWECLIAFILSQWSNVPRIAGQIEALSKAYGTEIGAGAFAFPGPEQLARATFDELRSLGLGYRVDYVQRAARKCAEQGTGWLEDLAHLDYRDARDRIVKPLTALRPSEKVHGVGPKVADCVLLFSLRHYEAIPVDVHVRRAMERWYGPQMGGATRYDAIADFGRAHFGRFAGYAQQYLFHRQRTG